MFRWFSHAKWVMRFFRYFYKVHSISTVDEIASVFVGCIFPIVTVSMLPHLEFGRNDHREDAPHVISSKSWPWWKAWISSNFPGKIFRNLKYLIEFNCGSLARLEKMHRCTFRISDRTWLKNLFSGLTWVETVDVQWNHDIPRRRSTQMF